MTIKLLLTKAEEDLIKEYICGLTINQIYSLLMRLLDTDTKLLFLEIMMERKEQTK
jgi:hypothetical protein